jgi:hypothetical protein
MRSENDIILKQPILGDVSVGYSGGMDSTTVAYLVARQGKGRVHLHTLRHGYGYLFHYWVKKTVRSLSAALGDETIVHRYAYTKGLFREIAMNTLSADRRKYGQPFGCCLGCTLSFITKMVIYNLGNVVPHIMFGSSMGGEYAVMSMPVTVQELKRYCARYGILYSVPLLENRIVKSAERKLLDEAGVYRGARFLDKHSFGNQGYCLLSVQHLPDVLLNVHPTYDPEQVRRFIADKLPRCEQYIKNHFERTGADLDASVTRLDKITSATHGPHQ